VLHLLVLVLVLLPWLLGLMLLRLALGLLSLLAHVLELLQSLVLDPCRVWQGGSCASGCNTGLQA
jgi:hypothetical protein